MRSREPGPPYWVEAILRATLSPSDRESISGDLLEEYRVAKQPILGTLRSDAWYIWQVVTILWHLIRPFAVALAALTVFSLTINGIHLWYGSLVPAPGLSLVHALIYLWAGYHCSRRTRLIRSGMLAAAATSLIGFTVFFAVALIGTPGLIVAPFSDPFIFVILSVLLLLALGYGVVVGTVGGAIGRWLSPPVTPQVRSS